MLDRELLDIEAEPAAQHVVAPHGEASSTARVATLRPITSTGTSADASADTASDDEHRRSPSGVIVYLCCADEAEVVDLHTSIRLLYTHFNGARGYPVRIFHDMLTAVHMTSLRQLAAAVSTHTPQTRHVAIDLDFIDLEPSVFALPAHIPPDIAARIPKSVRGYGMGYRHMCRFFSGPLFAHPALSVCPRATLTPQPIAPRRRPAKGVFKDAHARLSSPPLATWHARLSSPPLATWHARLSSPPLATWHARLSRGTQSYELIWRLDSDSYILAQPTADPFEQMDEANATYAWIHAYRDEAVRLRDDSNIVQHSRSQPTHECSS